MSFSVGDVVKAKSPVGGKRIKDAIGVIVKIDSMVLIEFDQDIGGHDGDGMGEHGYCWYLFKNDVEPYNDFFPWDEPEVNPDKPLNDYSRACWHCKPGGVVDALAFASGLILLCPVCGRVCDGRTETL